MIQKKHKTTELIMSSKKRLKQYFEANDNENTKIQNLWDAAKAVHSRKLTVIQAFLKKQETSQINNLVHHLKESE